MIRSFVSMAFALLLTWSLLLALNASINMDSPKLTSISSPYSLDFVRVKRSTDINKKVRIKPKKPKPPPPPPKKRVPNFVKPKAPTHAPVRTPQLRITPPVNLSASSILGDAFVSSESKGVVSTGLVPLVRVNPIYPRRAKKLKKEGGVKLEFTITRAGTVRDISIVESKPKKVFDNAAIRALSKWKFRAKVVDGNAVEQRASVQINFRLER